MNNSHENLRSVQSINKEIIGLDIVRFLCAMSVIFCHFLPDISGRYEWFVYGGSGVNVFFVISGFIISLSAEGRSPFEFIRSRFLRLVPAVWVCATLTLAFLLIFTNYSIAHNLWQRYVATIVLLPVVPWTPIDINDLWISRVYWTLFVEISFYVLIFILLVLNLFRHIQKVATVLGFISFAYWAVLILSFNYYPDAHQSHVILATGFKRYFDLTLVHHGAWFGVGINLWLMSKTNVSSRWFSFFICLLGGIFQSYYHSIFQLKMSPIPGLIYSLAGVVLVALSIAFKFQGMFSVNIRMVCRWIGLTTYPLYLVHDKIGLVTIDILVGRFGMGRELTSWLVIPFFVLLAFIIAYFIEPRLRKVCGVIFDRLGAQLASSKLSFLFKKSTVYFDGESGLPRDVAVKSA